METNVTEDGRDIGEQLGHAHQIVQDGITKPTELSPTPSMDSSEPRLYQFAPPNSTTISDILIVFFYHMIPFTPLPSIVLWVSLAWVYKRWGWLPVSAFISFLLLLLLIPPYYRPKLRRKLRVLYEALARYVPSAQFIVPKVPFPEHKAYIFAFHPHGRMFYSASMFSLLHEIWREPIKLKQGDLFQTAAGGFFQVPLLRNWFYIIGSIPVDKRSIVTKLRQKNHVTIAVGGVKEVCLGTRDDVDMLYLKRRSGFLKTAMEENAGVVPVYAFNENQLFSHDSKGFLKFWEVVNRYCRIGVPFMRGYYNLPMPYRKKLLVVIGDPLFAKEGESLAEFHERYIEAVKGLFQRNVSLSPRPSQKLVIK